jgi:beta-glucosidase-like glycosyl hydrolase
MSDVARLALPALRWRTRGGYSHERERIDEALRLGVGGFILFRAPAEVLETLTRELTERAGRPLLFGADFERGPAQQGEGLTELPPPAALGALDDLRATWQAGAITGAQARHIGINLVFAPVSDLDTEPENPIVQTRAFGADPQQVGAQVAAWVRGCEQAGAMTTVKHYPGHGRPATDSHEELPIVRATLDELETTDLVPFRMGIDAGASGLMTAHVSYPAWDPTRRAATYSSTMLDYARSALGFGGVIVTDALNMAGAVADNPEVVATRTAVASGCDLLLHPTDSAGVIRGLERWSRDAEARRSVDRALERYTWALAQAERPALPANPLEEAHAFADGLASRALRMLQGDPPSLRTPLDVEIVDDDVGGPYRVPPRDVFQQSLETAGVPFRPGGTRVVLVYSEPRSWKGRASLGPASLEALAQTAPGAALVVHFAPPRFASQIPGSAPVLGAWHGMPLLQRAAARWLMEYLA